MKTTDVIKHYGTHEAAAKAVGLGRTAVTMWGEYPPIKHQLEIERLTGGALVHTWPVPDVEPETRDRQSA